jgi:hypothetical protein
MPLASGERAVSASLTGEVELLRERVSGLETAVYHLANVKVRKAAESAALRHEAFREADAIKHQQTAEKL